jgi:hypothetical protein
VKSIGAVVTRVITVPLGIPPPVIICPAAMPVELGMPRIEDDPAWIAAGVVVAGPANDG